MTNENETKYEITSDLFGDGGLATFKQIADMVKDWQYDGWDLSVETSGYDVRIYANRIDENADSIPSRFSNWVMVTDDYGYLTVATEKPNFHEEAYNAFMDAINADDTEALAEIADNAWEYTPTVESPVIEHKTIVIESPVTLWHEIDIMHTAHLTPVGTSEREGYNRYEVTIDERGATTPSAYIFIRNKIAGVHLVKTIRYSSVFPEAVIYVNGVAKVVSGWGNLDYMPRNEHPFAPVK